MTREELIHDLIKWRRRAGMANVYEQDLKQLSITELEAMLGEAKRRGEKGGRGGGLFGKDTGYR